MEGGNNYGDGGTAVDGQSTVPWMVQGDALWGEGGTLIVWELPSYRKSLASFPGSPRARTKNRKEWGEPGKIYHVRNVIGRENLITCGRTNELAHAVWTEYSCDSFMADRMGLDGTMLHYLAVRKAMVSLHRPVHSKITLTYSLTWQTDRCTPRRMAFKALLNAKAALS